MKIDNTLDGSILQQFRKHELSLLSLDELQYKNPDMTKREIKHILEKLVDTGLLERKNLPDSKEGSKFYELTNKGKSALQEAQASGLMEDAEYPRDIHGRDAHIEQIEEMKRDPLS